MRSTSSVPPSSWRLVVRSHEVGRGRNDASAARRRQVTFEEAFLRLNGREPTGEEKRDALMIQDVVQGAELDPVLLVFLALGKYETLYRQGAQRITNAVNEAAAQAAAIGERVGRERAEQAAVDVTLRKLAAAFERQAPPVNERSKQFAVATAIAVVVAGSFLTAQTFARIDGTATAQGSLEPSQWLPPWGWISAGILLAEGLRPVARSLLSRAPSPREVDV